MVEKYINAFKEISTPTIRNGEELLAWQSKAINVVVRTYGENSIQEQQILNVEFRRYSSWAVNGQSFGGGDNSVKCQNQASEVILGFISDLTNFGLPEKRREKKEGINISVNQHQNQTIKLRLIFETINDELTGKQAKDLEEILCKDENLETKKKNLIEKIKSFGADVASNIVAGILTNPNIYS